MDALPLSQFAACIERTWGSSGSDNLISLCLWDAGHAFVDPGHWLRHRHSLAYVAFVRPAVCPSSHIVLPACTGHVSSCTRVT